MKQYRLYTCFIVHSDIESKELQLSEDQSQVTKCGVSFTSSQDHSRQFRTKAVKMKTKLREAPYLEVGHPRDLEIIKISEKYRNK